MPLGAKHGIGEAVVYDDALIHVRPSRKLFEP